MIYEMVLLLTMVWRLHVFYPKDRFRSILTNISIMRTKETNTRMVLLLSSALIELMVCLWSLTPKLKIEGAILSSEVAISIIQYPIQYTRVDNVIRWDQRSRCIFFCVVIVIVIGGLQKTMIGKDNEKHTTKQRT